MNLQDWPILTAAETRAAEQAMFDAGTDPYALMVRAGESAAEQIWRIGHKRPTLILCGPGNNGGDGFVVARSLRDRGVPVRVAVAGESRTDSARRARADWAGPVEDIATAEPAVQTVDALFGVGLTRGLDPALAERLCALVEAGQRSFAVDVPSGVDSDSGAILSAVPRFDVCLAIGVLKPAHLLLPAADRAGAVLPIAIGLEAGEASCRLLAAPRLSAPARDAHKYRRGLVAIVAGRMAGACALSAEAAARGGAGYVRLVGAQAILPLSHAIVRASGKSETALADERIAALLVGPGLGRDERAREQLAAVLATAHPVVVDADALHLLAQQGLDSLPPQAILTPHDGEYAALFGDVPGNRIERARIAAARANAVVVLKGSDTVVAAPDGRARVATGLSSWLSTAGTGDVLAGLCAARLAVTADPFLAACEAVWLHGEAARRAGAAFAADDLIPHLSPVMGSRSR
ncbi:NAD(P)H-hydrate dehydratase [Sphingobium sufflavum]|uniref:NAD(P)H-hydrate dehydratase n=1 Tax=Sphingobium sufflavum TaxID=1129547 RepID=UPI001F2207BD|nr:NAD(P)H-hydrate dehydratase [Sphingobium sufflavum]MCE7798553.1 NAD(P)H-hydrate dehydratase [Sphingobium sufflavum]